MSQSISSAAMKVRPERAARGLVGWLFTSNPFYVLSADLVFIGLRMSFDTSGTTIQTGALMGSLLGYTLLLAATACLLIRRGKVWDDARTILLLVVAMFLAISVTFDETLARNPGLGRRLYQGGLVFAVLVTEGVLRAIHLRLPAIYRIPYYLILALFFLYPLVLVPQLGNPDGVLLRWLLFGFSPAAGLLFLSLIPAIRRGGASMAKNGSPWPYPLYPWVLFGLLASAACGRTSYLCISFHFVGHVNRPDTIFGAYFLVPFLLALEVLIIEAAAISRRQILRSFTTLSLPLVLLVASTRQGQDPVFRAFLELFREGLGGSPF